MYLAVTKVKPINSFKLLLTFENGEERQLDMNPFLNKGMYRDLRDVEMFKTVHISFDTIEWDNEADLDPETLYKLSEKL